MAAVSKHYRLVVLASPLTRTAFSVQPIIATCHKLGETITPYPICTGHHEPTRAHKTHDDWVVSKSRFVICSYAVDSDIIGIKIARSRDYKLRSRSMKLSRDKRSEKQRNFEDRLLVEGQPRGLIIDIKRN